MSALLRLYREAFRGLPREVWWLSFAFFVNRCGTMVLPFLVLYLTSQRAYSEFEAGLVLALYGLGGMGGVAAGGWLVDRIGFKPVQVWSFLFSGLGFIIYGFLRHDTAMHVGAVLLGFVSESFRPANGAAIAAFSTPATRARAFGLSRLAANLGWTLAPVVAGFLAEVNYGYLFWIDGLTCISAAWILARTVPAMRPESSAEGTPARARSPWVDGLFMLFFGLVILQGLIWFQFQSTYPLFLKEQRGFVPSGIGMMFAVNTILIVLFEMPLVKRIEGQRPFVILALSSLCVGVGFGLTPLAHHTAWLIALACVWTLGEMFMAPMGLAWVANRAGPRSRGRYMAAFAICFSIAATLGPMAGTWVYEHVSPNHVWTACLAIGLVTAAGFLGLAGPRKQPTA